MIVKNTLDYGMWKETGPNLHSLLQKSDSVDAYSPAMRPLRPMILNSVLPATLQTATPHILQSCATAGCICSTRDVL